MNRRKFIAASVTAAAVSANVSHASSASGKQQYIEFRRYHTLLGSKKGLLNAFLKNAAIPALNRIGIGPVGVFNVKYGQQDPTLYVLLPHDSMESAMTATRRLMDDEEYLSKGAEFLDAPLSDPSYVRLESSLMRAFSGMPSVEIPEAVKGKKSRIFELRTYESHSEKAAKKKIEMFNEGGEIQIFRDTGLQPVFFGESLIGPKLPNLVYMLAFEDMDQRNKNWGQFGSSAGWKALRVKPEYKDTVSNISDVILRPASFSQI